MKFVGRKKAEKSLSIDFGLSFRRIWEDPGILFPGILIVRFLYILDFIDIISSTLITSKMGKFVVTKTSNGQFRWALKAGNGETLITSESYVSKSGCLNGIASSRVSVNDSNFKKLNAKNDAPYFNQVANNHQVIGTSQMYSSAAARDNGIESVKKNAPEATIEDLTVS
jgi:uncharacterized protein YegP (UPF0339 family)